MKPSILSLLLLCLVVASTRSVQIRHLPYDVVANPHSSNLIVGEPLFLTSVISNAGPEKVLLYWNPQSPAYQRGGAYGTIQLSTNGLTFWDWAGFEEVGSNNPKELLPSQTFTQVFTLLYNPRGQIAFPAAGTNWIRSRFRVLTKDEIFWVGSPSMLVTTRQPGKEDEAVWALLGADETYRQLSRSPGAMSLSDARLQEYDRTLQSFTNSNLASYLAFFLGRHFFEFADRTGPIDTVKAKQYLITAQERAKVPGLKMLITNSLNQIALIDEWRRREERMRMQTNELAAAIAELESQWYDVKSITETMSDLALAFAKKHTLLRVKFNNSEISGQEFDSRSADLLRNFVTNHMKSLPPEEWKKRYAEHVRRRAEQERKDAEKRKALDLQLKLQSEEPVKSAPAKSKP